MLCSRRIQHKRWIALFIAAFLLSPVVLKSALAQDAAKEADAAATREYAVALGFQKKKLYTQAASRWAKFIQAHPKSERIPNANYHLGVCQFQLKQLPAAQTTFQGVLSKYPTFQHLDGAQFNLGLVQYNVAIASAKPADYKVAATTFAVVPAKFAKSKYAPDALYYQAECLYLSGDKAAAIPVYQKVVTSFPKSPLLPQMYYALGTTQQELEQFGEAATTYQAYVTKFPKGAQVNECRLRLGMAQLSLKKYLEAEKLFAVVAAVPEFAYADFALLQQAQAVFAQEKLPESAVLYESLPKKFVKSGYIGAALLAGGKCRFRAKQFAEAQADLTPVTLNKELAEAAEANYWLARTLIELKKPADAVKVAEPAIAAYPKSEFLPQLVFVRIDALFDQETRRKETVALYATFAKAYAMHELAPIAQYRACFSAHSLQDYPSAAMNAETFLANPLFAKHMLAPDVLYIGGESYLLAEKPDLVKAEALYRRLITEHAMHKQVPQSRVRVGFCLYSSKKYDDAVAFLTQSIPTLKEPNLLAETYLLIGRSHGEANRPKPAIVAFQASVAANPKWERGDEVLFALALGLRTDKNDAAAANQLTKLNAAFPKSTFRDQAFYQLADIAFVAKNYDFAVTNYRQVVTGFPKGDTAPPAQYGIGSALFQKEDYANSVAELGKLLTAYPTAEISAKGTYLRGLAYQRLKKFAPAVADLTKFIASKPAEKDAIDAQFALALCQIGLKQHPQAIATLTALLAAKPDYSDADKAYYELAFAYFATKKDKEAADTLQTLASKLPDSPLVGECWFRVGEFHEKSKNLPEAAKAFTTGLTKAKKPELRERLFYKLGWVQYEQKAYPDATKSFLTQIQEYPKGELLNDGTYLAAESLYRQNKFTEALPLYLKVVTAKAEKYHARALYRSGDCAANAKQWPASQLHYQALITQFPKFEQINEARYGLGFALQNQTKLDEAKKVYLEVTKATNTETAAKCRFMIGECSFAQKNYSDAVEHFLEAAIGYPYEEWQALGYFEAGRCFIELKDTAKAQETLETVIKKFPKHDRAKDAATLIAGLEK